MCDSDVYVCVCFCFGLWSCDVDGVGLVVTCGAVRSSRARHGGVARLGGGICGVRLVLQTCLPYPCVSLFCALLPLFLLCFVAVLPGSLVCSVVVLLCSFCCFYCCSGGHRTPVGVECCYFWPIVSLSMICCCDPWLVCMHAISRSVYTC